MNNVRSIRRSALVASLASIMSCHAIVSLAGTTGQTDLPRAQSRAFVGVIHLEYNDSSQNVEAKFAYKDGSARIECSRNPDHTIWIFRKGKAPLTVYPKKHGFIEGVASESSGGELGDEIVRFLQTWAWEQERFGDGAYSAQFPGMELVNEGEQTIDGHRCTKYRFGPPTQLDPSLYVYVARGLDNLVIRADLPVEKNTPDVVLVRYRITEVRLGAADDLFELDPEYSKLR